MLFHWALTLVPLLVQVKAYFLPLDRSLGQSLDIRGLADFNFVAGGAGSSTDDQKNQIDKWLKDIEYLAGKAVDKLNNYATSRHVAFSARAFIGLFYNFQGGWFGDLKVLASTGRGGTIANSWLFCGDNFQEMRSGSDWVQKPDGSFYTRLNAQNQKENVKIRDIPTFTPYIVDKGLVPIWIPAMGGYAFAVPGKFTPGSPGSECTKSYAFTTPVAGNRRLFVLCHPRGTQGGSLFTDLAGDVINGTTARSGQLMDAHFSRSGALMHEMFHAVAGAGQAPDVNNNHLECFHGGLSKNGRTPEGSRKSPQCLVEFAMAMHYLDQNPGNPWVFLERPS
ncbi:hypothetical protein BKA67DRAFT_659094 [Truncatella angustata]|uniref:Metalloprotease n=1 Tax=Truncatella angustata TaxID=152316 RepID=A0A9P8UML2_9PEZI|nr:uncharacterized protein BKA67DRAFT_659094 [Truncatella angustata]KAH6654826.1 hypothetical protein BKA67DRAFT_659094 [Truncatella angustata]KAH8196950.1 hypothetical protein TruAng_008877 [Truncatella angustata]